MTWLRRAWRRCIKNDGELLVYVSIGLLMIALLALYILEEFP